MLLLAPSLSGIAISPCPQRRSSSRKLPPRMYDIQSFILEHGVFKDLPFRVLHPSGNGAIQNKVKQLQAALEKAFPEHPEFLDAFFIENLGVGDSEILGQALLRTAQTLEKNQFLLRAILKRFPDVGKFMIQLEGKNQMTFSLEGYELLLEIMRQRKRLTVACRICITEKEWRESFEKFLSGSDKKASWIIRNADAHDRMDATIHYFPMIAEKEDGIVHVALTDSLGKEGFAHQYIQPLIGLLRGQKRACIYMANEIRQYFAVGCPIFSLRDIIHLSKFPRSMKFLHDHSHVHDSYKEPNISVYEIDDLPPPLMRYTHDLERLVSYEDRINAPEMTEEAFPLVHLAIGETSDLEQIPPTKFLEPLAAKKHIRVENSEEGGGKSYNLLVRDRYLKYCAMVVAVAVAFGHTLKRQ